MTTRPLKEMSASAEAIEHHYDLSNDFYALWLDPSMTYTAALWDGDEPLAAAQQRKIDHVLGLANARGARRLLDVGCGWGGALRRARGAHGVGEAVGLTLSRSQAAWIAARPTDRLSVRVESWAEHAPAEPYGAIISVEAFEAFARPGLTPDEKVGTYRAFFQRCHDWLEPGGSLALQTIAYGNSGPADLDGFISGEIFPESDLPRLAEIAEATERRFELVSLTNDRAGYARTLKAWLANLKARRGEAVERVGLENVVRYERFLRLSIFMFETGACDLFRMSFRRIDRPRPITVSAP